MSSDMAKDLGRHMQKAIGEVVNRHIATARIVLGPADVSIMVIEAAIGLSLSAIATVGHAAKPGCADGVMDATRDGIIRQLTSERARERVTIAAQTGVGTL